MPGGLIDPAGRPQNHAPPFSALLLCNFWAWFETSRFSPQKFCGTFHRQQRGACAPSTNPCMRPPSAPTWRLPCTTWTTCSHGPWAQVVQVAHGGRHCGLRSLVAAERAVPLQSSLTVSCSSHQGASACNDAAVVRVAAAPSAVVLFVVLLVLVVAVCCCCCAIPAASPCVRPASLYHLDRYILGGARACGCAILAGGPTSRLEAVARA